LEPIKFNLLVTIRKASYYPTLSNLSFQIGSFILFLFCSTYLPLSEIGFLTMILSYWGVLFVPAEAFSETALNYFSSIYSKKKTVFFQTLRKNIIETSLTTSTAIFIVLFILDYIFYGNDSNKLLQLSIVSTVVL